MAVLTDQPSWVCAYVVRRFGFDHAICTEAAVRDGVVGVVRAYNFAKRVGLEAYAGGHGVPLAAVAHVGNGANDIPVFQAIGWSVAFNPSSEAVAAAARAVVRTKDLRDALPHLLPGAVR